MSGIAPLDNGGQEENAAFAAVWTATIASQVTFCSIFQALQDSQTFAPLTFHHFQIFANFGDFFFYTEPASSRYPALRAAQLAAQRCAQLAAQRAVRGPATRRALQLLQFLLYYN